MSSLVTMYHNYFITGTDTDCGKTEITLGLMQGLQDRGISVLGMKPVASGAVTTAYGPRNDDAVRIRQQASEMVDYDLVNPFAYAPPIAPHLAAEQVGREIDFWQIRACYQALSLKAESVIVEGVGGWRVPLGKDQALSDLAVILQLPVILVVGLKLGCINHAILTAESIKSSGLRLAGWVANVVDEAMLEPEANIETLKQHIDAPLLGFVPRLEEPTPQAVASCLIL
ncbi:MAG: dethiobiotin synthase [Sedimenticola sp.]